MKDLISAQFLLSSLGAKGVPYSLLLVKRLKLQGRIAIRLETGNGGSVG
jgi:hypothetical protein